MTTDKNSVNWQIAKYQTSKKLMELVDKLKPTTPENAPHIHAGRCKEMDGNNRRLISCIGVRLLDYSAGTGAKTVQVDANISPEQCMWIHAILLRGDKEFNLTQDKIVSSAKDAATGRCPVTKMTIARAEVGSDGKKRTHPWYVKIENGTGVSEKTSTGGFMIQKNSYKQERQAYVNLNDMDMFTLFHRAASYIQVWEMKNGCDLLRQRGA